MLGLTRVWGFELLLLLTAGLIGYLVAVPVLMWHRRDLHSFPRPLWAGYGSRTARLRGAIACYLAAGWPELFMALSWRRSITRAALVVERDNFREARHSWGSTANGAP